MSIELGNNSALFNYSNMLKKGEGIGINYSEARKYFKMAADKGDKDTMMPNEKFKSEGFI